MEKGRFTKMMVQKKAQFIALIICCMIPVAISAQDYSKHEFSLYGGGGLSTLSYSLDNGSQTHGFGGHFGLGYTYFFTPHWGIGTGVELAFYNAKGELDNRQFTTPAFDGVQQFSFNYAIYGHSEKQKATYLQIPLMIQYQTGGKHKFYAAVGAKVGIPLKSTYDTEFDKVTTWGYYSETNTEVTSPAEEGFGTYNNRDFSGDTDLELAWLAAVELGYKWHLSDRFSLYTGVYADYGLNKVNEQQSNSPLIGYSKNPNNFTSASILEASNYESKKVIPIAAGIKVKITMHGKRVQPHTNYVSRPVSTRPVVIEEVPEQIVEMVEVVTPAVQIPAVDLTGVINELSKSLNNFEYSKSQLNPTMRTMLDTKAGLLKNNTNMMIHCTGYTCNTGGNFNNIELGQHRADAVKKYLVSQGVDASRITTSSEGEKNPVASNATEKGKSENRRVEIKVIP